MMNLMLYDKLFRVKVYTWPLVKKNGVKSDKHQGATVLTAICSFLMGKRMID